MDAQTNMVSRADLRLIPEEWIETKMPPAGDRTVLDFIREQVETRPEAVAIQCGQRQMTYEELDGLSDQIAFKLQQHGLKEEEPVAILSGASCEFIIAILGVIKAGGAYLPIDPQTPAKRLEFLLNDSRSRFACTDATGLARLQTWHGLALDLTAQTLPLNPPAESFANRKLRSNSRAYVIYTSGSTGQPKGVEIEHHSLTNLVCYYHRHLNMTAADRFSMLAHVSFDVSVADIWPVLCAGGCLVIPTRELLANPDDLIHWLQTERITLSFVPTGVAEILFQRNWPDQISLRYLFTGGDRLLGRPATHLPFTIINGYGPTESTVFCTMGVVLSGDARLGAPPIGRPMGNVRVYVLDDLRQPVPVGVAGELYVGGEQVARGYFGRPELTGGKFIPDPFSFLPGARMYRTGDWVRWLPEGELEFLGRRDDQIQIRGMRIELGEIEALLFSHPDVRQVCCVPRMNNDMPTSVVAHIVPHEKKLNLSSELGAYLSSRLPEYMVPSAYVEHDRLPLTPQGKTDRAALRTMESSPFETGGINSDLDGIEGTLHILWRSLLPAAKHSPPDSSFAQLGGDSLLAIRLMLGVEEITGRKIEVSSFLINPTFPSLCELVRTRLAQSTFDPVLIMRKHGNRSPLFCIYGHNGDVNIYFNLVEVLGDDQPVIGIRSPALRDTSHLLQSIEEAAGEVVRLIRQVYPEGKPALLGYSWGGLLAFEVARQFMKAEGVTCFTALVGTNAPILPTTRLSRSFHMLQHFPTWMRKLLQSPRRWKYLKHSAHKARGVAHYVAKGSLPSRFSVTSPISYHLLGLMETYSPSLKAAIPVELFREKEGNFLKNINPLLAWQWEHLTDAGWSHWTNAPVRVHIVGGDHATMINPPLASGLAKSIRQAMDQHLH